MLSGSRYCLRSRVVAVADKLPVSAHEPLLFLYPRFFASQFEGSHGKPLTTLPVDALRTKRRPKLLCRSQLKDFHCDTSVRQSSQLAVHQHGSGFGSTSSSAEASETRSSRGVTPTNPVTRGAPAGNEEGKPSANTSGYSASEEVSTTASPVVISRYKFGPIKTPKPEIDIDPELALAKQADLLALAVEGNGPQSNGIETKSEDRTVGKDLLLQSYPSENGNATQRKHVSGRVRSGQYVGLRPKTPMRGMGVRFAALASRTPNTDAHTPKSRVPDNALADIDPTFMSGKSAASGMAPLQIYDADNASRGKHSTGKRAYGSESPQSIPPGTYSRTTTPSTRDPSTRGSKTSSPQLDWLGISNLLKARDVDKPFDPQYFKLCQEVADMLFALSKEAPETPFMTFESQKVIELPEEAVVTLGGDDVENSWDISVVSGCRVHVLPRKEDDYGPMRKVRLLGSPKAVEMGEKQIMAELGYPEGSKRSSLPPFVRFTDKPKAPRVRSVWSTRRMRAGVEGQIERTLRKHGVWMRSPSLLFDRPKKTIDRVDDIPMPESWTIRTFADYVESITTFRHTKSPHRVIYDNGDVHEIIVKNILLRLCQNPENRKYFSARTMTLVIGYLHHHKFFEDIGTLFPVFSDFFTSRTFSTLLRSAAANYNMKLFKTYVNIMKNHHIRPNEWCWVAFIHSIGSEQFKAHFLDEIYNRGILKHPTTIRHAVSATIRYKFRASLKNGERTSEFLTGMARKFGDNWLSTLAVNKMILETTLTKNLEARNEIFRYCFEKQLKLNTNTLNNVLLYYVDTKHARAGVNFFAKFVKLYRPKLSLMTWQLLWFLAVRRRSYALCRVIWRYACLQGSATVGIAKTVMRSLARPLEPDRELTIGQRWFINLGKIVVGVLPVPKFLTENNRLEGQYPSNPKVGVVEHLCTDAENGPPMEWREELAKILVERDLKSGSAHIPSIPLPDLLMRAIDREIFWTRATTDVLLQRKKTIPVPIQPKFWVKDRVLQTEEQHQEEIEDALARSGLEDMLKSDDDFPDLEFRHMIVDYAYDKESRYPPA
ncbi:hypothetical protein CPC735_045720 [Coccidioides posadasii C735 delta SOWgp]|uniref:Uncharacterized protein n=1 Tax=Coccidioides posadasii (strain C735) TaxID=222929 RepID=C5PEY4_COCP7|nr:hypothetical protein CPC735_045720 [Coccidioides posadasii C735 delta SOWgp]EER23202.1 hypothetical protein CPC735_045720 [Coccidioides posadasii C735 delta SOWgp]|eukprot:XP_003065347.1 hypothetical protein CPC735_045720 [Coccidioides posadasii C735 delta SOWgp]